MHAFLSSVRAITLRWGEVRNGPALLMKHTYPTRIFLISILVLALVVPAAALAAPGGGDSGKTTERTGIAPAQPVLSPLTGPVQRFHRAIRVGVHRIRVARRRVLRAQHEQQEAFTTLPGGVSLATLDAIAACESGGDPTAVSSDGSYRGKYQFDYGTWASVGGSGDPAAAPEAEQDFRAALLYSEAGSSPWPVCG
jgi:Transglycosylase-like domain